MSFQAIDRIGSGFSELLELLDGQDNTRMEAVLQEVRVALEEVRAEGTGRDTHEVTGRIRDIMPLIEAARVRVNLLTDETRQRVDLLAFHAGKLDLPTYKP
jgi:hypothetical protein